MRRALAMTLAACLLVSTVGGATTWQPFKALKLFVDDESDSAATIYTARGGYFLVEPGGADHVYLLVPADLAVFRIAADAVPRVAGRPSIETDDTSGFQRLDVLDRDGSNLSWDDGARHFLVSARPPLIGVATLDEILEHKPQYRAAIDAYEPDAGAIDAIRKLEAPTELIVAFGTWCSNCAEWLPRFIRTVTGAGNDRIRVTYLSISEDLARPAAEIEKYGIDGVPAFIARRDGHELGRIDLDTIEATSNPILERMLVGILDGRAR